MLVKIIQIILSFAVFFSVYMCHANAAPYVFFDNFTDKNNIDTTATTAYIDTSKQTVLDGITDTGLVTLQKLISNSLEIKKDLEYVVLNGSSIETYSFDGESMINNNMLAINDPTAIGISLRSDNMSISVLKPDGISTYGFDGSGMTENPLLSVEGLNKPVSITTVKSDNISVLSQDGSINTYSFDGNSLINNPLLSVNTSITNPLMIASSKDENSYVVLDGNEKEIKTYMFDGTGMVENPLLSISGLTSPLYISAKRGSNDVAVIDGRDIKYYQFTGSSMIQNDILSLSADEYGLVSPIAVAIHPYESSLAVIDEGKIKYFQFDGTKMVENPAMEVEGISAAIGGYISGKVYQSKQVLTDEPIKYIYLSVLQNIPSETSITYDISTNGGLTWAEIMPNSWKAVPEGKELVLRATLITNNPSQAPEIYRVTLYAANFIITYIENPPLPQTLPTTTMPVTVKAGYYIGFDLYPGGQVSSAGARIYGGTMDKEVTMNLSANRWYCYTYTDETLNTGDVVSVRIKVPEYPEDLVISPMANILGSVLDDIRDHSVELTN